MACIPGNVTITTWAKGLFLSDHCNWFPWLQTLWSICAYTNVRLIYSIVLIKGSHVSILPNKTWILWLALKPCVCGAGRGCLAFTQSCSLIANWLRNCCSQTYLQYDLVCSSHSFPYQFSVFLTGLSKAISKRISLFLSCLVGLCFPFMQFLSHERHNCIRRAPWNLRGVDCSLHSAQCRRTSVLAIWSLFPNLQISERSISVHLVGTAATDKLRWQGRK